MAALIPSASASGSGTMTLSGPSTNSNQTITIPDATGTMMVSGNMPAFSAYANTNQTISSATWTKVTLGVENFDTNNNFASSRFTATVAGYYQINGSIGVNGGVTETLAGIYKNGSPWLYGSDSTASYISSVSSLVYLNGTTDYVELYGFLLAGTSIVGLLERTQFSGYLARAA